MSVSAIATRGLGMSARAHSRSTTPCRSGASAGLTSRAPAVRSAILSDQNNEPNASTAPRTTAKKMITPVPCFKAANEYQRGHKGHEDESQQEHRQTHPRLQPPVGRITGSHHRGASVLPEPLPARHLLSSITYQGSRKFHCPIQAPRVSATTLRTS